MQMKKKLIKEAIVRTLSYSTLHGIPNIIRNPFMLVKLLWLICLLCSASYFVYSIFISIGKYFEYQVDTKIEIKRLNEVSFPIVKICRHDLNKQQLSGSPTSDLLVFRSLLIYYRNLFKSNDEHFHKTIGLANLNDVLISCIYNLKPCNSSDFSYFYDFGFGSCWQFNSGKDINGNNVPLRKAKETGVFNGLSLELYLGDASENYNLFSNLNSFQITITNETTDSILIEGFKISAGISTHFTLEKYTMKTLEKPYGNCVNNLVTDKAYSSECYNKTLQQSIKQNRLYHYTDCSYMCFQKLLTETCDCYSDISERYYLNIYKKCIEPAQIPCAQKVYIEFLNNRTHMDLCDCPRECSEVGYSVTSSYANYPTKYRAEFLAKKMKLVQNKFLNESELNQSRLEKSLASVHIYFNELKEMKISQKPKMLMIDLIAQIGSQMGVFLGNSFLSFVELFEILLETLIIVWRSKL